MDNTKFTKQFVALTMATLRADGIIEQVELDTIKEQAADLELDMVEVEKFIAETSTASWTAVSLLLCRTRFSRNRK